MSIFRQFVCGQQSDNKPEEPVRWPGLTRGAKKWWAANAENSSCLEVWANHSENKKYNQRLLGKVPLSNILYRVLILEWGFTMKPRESGCGRNQFFSKVSKHTFFAKLVSQPRFLFALRQSFFKQNQTWPQPAINQTHAFYTHQLSRPRAYNMRGRVNFLCFTPTQKLRAVAAKMVIHGARVGYNSRLVKDLHRQKVFLSTSSQSVEKRWN